MMPKVFTVCHVDETPSRVESITAQPTEQLFKTTITAKADGRVQYTGNTYPNLESMLSAWGLTLIEERT
jgi:hypothetical protein